MIRHLPPLFTITVKGLLIPEKERPDLEKAAAGMTTKADSLGYLDPLESEPDVVFDPTL